jgi:hypothetical protein
MGGAETLFGMRYCGANSVKALGALLDKIRPAIVLVHSQSGAYGLDLIGQRCRYLAGALGTAWTTSPARFEFPITPGRPKRSLGAVKTWNKHMQGTL